MTLSMEFYLWNIYCVVLTMLICLDFNCLYVNGVDIISPRELSEYCATETFYASCEEGQVIQMTTAKYGRMNIGKCVKQNIGYLGCFADVLSLADKKCSGRRECKIRIPDTEFDAQRPCYEELKTYFEAAYLCVDVVTPVIPCTELKSQELSTPSGVLSSLVTSETQCGGYDAPWFITAEPGQTISVTFFDFNIGASSSLPYALGSPSMVECAEFAFLLDPAARRKIKICPDQARIRSVYESVNNTLEVALKPGMIGGQEKHYLIEYKFVGCPDFHTAEGMWFARINSHEGVVGCATTTEKWTITCLRNDWVGEIKNCSLLTGISGDAVDSDGPRRHGGIAMIIVVAFGLVIGLIIIGAAIYCVKRLRHRNRENISLEYDFDDLDGADKLHQMRSKKLSDDITIRNNTCTERVRMKNGNEYTKVVDGRYDHDYDPPNICALHYSDTCTQPPPRGILRNSVKHSNVRTMPANKLRKCKSQSNAFRNNIYKQSSKSVYHAPSKMEQLELGEPLKAIYPPPPVEASQNQNNLVILENCRSNPRYSVMYRMADYQEPKVMIGPTPSNKTDYFTNTI